MSHYLKYCCNTKHRFDKKIKVILFPQILSILLEIRYKIIEIMLYKVSVISHCYLCGSIRHAYYKHSPHTYHNTITAAVKHFRQ